MSRTRCFFIMLVACLLPLSALASPTIFPTGVTIYNPEKAYNGFTVIGPSWWNESNSSYLVDMNGNIVKEWKGLMGHSAKILPGGYIQGQYGKRKAAYLNILDFDGNVVRKFEQFPMNHDAQFEGNPAGYFAPGMEPKINGKILINSQHGVIVKHKMPVDYPVQGNNIYEIDANNRVIWQWEISEHFDELGLTPEAIKSLKSYYKYDPFYALAPKGTAGVDWAHINSVAYVGPNKWYSQDPVKYAAFNPDNIIWASRNMSMLGIIDRETGKLAWKLGPNFGSNPALAKMGNIIGAHGTHIIPKGLPGEGNILLLDNGGYSGFGAPAEGNPDGVSNMRRHYSRVLEINPTTFEVVWEYTAEKAKIATSNNPNVFFTPLQGNVQRLPNGNTLITEAAFGRVFEVTPKRETVWEYIDPNWRDPSNFNVVFKAFRAPYEWVPQAKHATQQEVIPPRYDKFKLVPQPDGKPAIPVLIEK